MGQARHVLIKWSDWFDAYEDETESLSFQSEETIAWLRERGCTVTDLIPATPELVAALEYVLRFAEIGVGHDQYDSSLQTIKELLSGLSQEATGDADTKHD